MLKLGDVGQLSESNYNMLFLVLGAVWLLSKSTRQSLSYMLDLVVSCEDLILAGGFRHSLFIGQMQHRDCLKRTSTWVLLGGLCAVRIPF